MFHVQKRAEEDLSVLRILLRLFYAAFPVLTHAYRSLSITFSIDLTGVLSILFRRFWNVVTDWPLYSDTFSPTVGMENIVSTVYIPENNIR